MACLSRLVFVVFVSLLIVIGSIRAAEPQDVTIDFNHDIRPLLSDRCFQCHGLDETRRETGLRLDQRASAVAEADSGELPIVPGNADASGLIAHLTESDGDYSDHPIDQLVPARLEERGIAPSPEADRVTLIRRLAFDLTGLTGVEPARVVHEILA